MRKPTIQNQDSFFSSQIISFITHKPWRKGHDYGRLQRVDIGKINNRAKEWKPGQLHPTIGTRFQSCSEAHYTKVLGRKGSEHPLQPELSSHRPSQFDSHKHRRSDQSPRHPIPRSSSHRPRTKTLTPKFNSTKKKKKKKRTHKYILDVFWTINYRNKAREIKRKLQEQLKTKE